LNYAEEFSLATYRKLLETVVELGWSFRTLSELLKPHATGIFLRHDIDAELYLLEPFLEVEKSLGVTSTYFLMLESPFYNVASPEGRRLVSKILASGSSIGLHFFGEIHQYLEPEQLLEEISRQVAELSNRINAGVSVFSFHQPSREMMKLNLDVPSVLNAYHESIMTQLMYLTDTNLQWNPESPLSALKSGVGRIQLLVHPLWWITEGVRPLDRWRQILCEISEAHAKHLLARERTLTGFDVADLVID